MLKKILSIVILALIAACSNQPKAVAVKPVIKTIAIIPAANPLYYGIRNDNAAQFAIPLIATATYIDGKDKGRKFTERLNAQSSSLGRDVTEEVANRLRAHGYEVSILTVSRVEDDPDYVDYESISTTADAILHVRFTEVGLRSSMTSTAYVPRMALAGTLFLMQKGEEVYLYDQEVNYGLDVVPGRERFIPADKKFAYQTFDAVLSNLDDVRAAFNEGALAMGNRMSLEIHETIK